ncbi:MAG: CDP-glycerol glycerophosphotransferase family protein [Bifidobacteriaceae bacterium]|nr:CDP-glycerol glycerophosphotransferase family protein [Bifidobacteriaceae bacterium]
MAVLGLRRTFSALETVRAIGLRPVVADLMGFTAMVVAFARLNPGAGIALAELCLALTVLFAWDSAQERTQPKSATGSFVGARIEAAVAAALLASAAGTGTARLAGLGLVVLTICFEPLVGRLQTIAVPYAANIPDVPTYSDARVPSALAFGVNTAAVGAVAAFSLSGSVFAVGLAAGAAALLASLAIAADAAQRILARHRFEHALPATLKRMGPTFALHWQAPEGTAYQAAMWIPHLQRLGKPFFVLVRTNVNFDEVRSRFDVPVILRRRLDDLDIVITDSLKSVFYVNTAVRNSHMLRYTNLTHVQLNHGDSDKVASFNPVFRMYSKDFVAGQAAIDRFAANGVDMPPEMFAIVGRPQVAGVAVAERPIGETEPKTVLYAPTWVGFYSDSDYCSLPAGKRLVKALIERGCTVVFRAHPYTSRSDESARQRADIIDLLEADAAASGRRHLYGPAAEQEMTIEDCFNASDALIADVSSVVPDYLFSEKPFAMVAVNTPAHRFESDFPVAKGGYVIDAFSGKVRGLGKALDRLLQTDPKAAERKALKAYYLGDFPPGDYARHFLDRAAEFV